MRLPDAPERLARLRALPVGAMVLAGVAGETGVHVVGGAVRDLLLGGTPHELDVVVEGDGVALARRAAERLASAPGVFGARPGETHAERDGAPVRVIVHERFGTATVRLGELSFDVAGARAESYPRPGALPEVRLGVRLAEDLARRDFTVNALAISLADGSLTAFPGAEADLVSGRLRVLHADSFTDDPTRLVRLARYAGRLGFAVEAGTRALALAAVTGGVLATVSGERLGTELRLLLREPQPAALAALDGLALGRAAVDPGFAVDAPLIARALGLSPAEARTDLVCLAACLLEGGDPGGALRRLAFPAAERDVVAEAAADARRVLRALREAHGAASRAPRGPRASREALAAAPLAPSTLWRALHPVQVETVVLAGALADSEWARVAVRRWFEEVRHAHPLIGGRDLVAAGLRGPAVGAGLEAALLAALDGTATTRETQLAVALDAGAGR